MEKITDTTAVQTTLRLQHGSIVDWGIDDGCVAATIYEGVIANWVRSGLTVERATDSHKAWVVKANDQRMITMTVVTKGS